ncbi:type II toxin-antitoxin system PemK/MazF family toxin [Pengzhenrongella sicca]|uniref:Type II toxin-antitoxin system PemK/MazF family toxin n=1 Tax=Pengzhenrongella sicca TaxID=2819238 RepID=A0A8A4ZH62_9MICO|nr:type II toxin-antitoxin system PemK/MazF family toxin [Pengzhenrongella sicca]
MTRGTVAWAELDGRGHEQAGRRPVLIVASNAYLATITSLAVVLPLTTVDRGWPNHVLMRGRHGLDRPSWAMTEQVRTISRARIVGAAGVVDAASLRDVDVYLRDFLGL